MYSSSKKRHQDNSDDIGCCDAIALCISFIFIVLSIAVSLYIIYIAYNEANCDDSTIITQKLFLKIGGISALIVSILSLLAFCGQLCKALDSSSMVFFLIAVISFFEFAWGCIGLYFYFTMDDSCDDTRIKWWILLFSISVILSGIMSGGSQWRSTKRRQSV